jgi:hypothetical protein
MRRRQQAAVVSTAGEQGLPLPPIAGTAPTAPPPVQVTGAAVAPLSTNANVAAAISGGSEVRVDAQVIRAPVAARIASRISESLADIRDAARALSEEFKKQAAELQSARHNDPDRIAHQNDLIDFFQEMAQGLTNLAEALDRLEISADTIERSFFLSQAADIARNLSQRTVRWLDEQFNEQMDRTIKVGLFGAGIAFLHWLGADTVAAVGALGYIIRAGGSGGTRKPPKKKESCCKCIPQRTLFTDVSYWRNGSGLWWHGRATHVSKKAPSSSPWAVKF